MATITTPQKTGAKNVARIALIGAGLIGREHAKLIASHPDAVLAAISDPSEDSAHYAATLGIPHFTSYQQMLDAIRPDGAIVAAPNALHLPAGLACIERSIPSLIEKPVADTVHAAAALVAAAEGSGVAVLVGHHRRHSPDIREARRVVANGDLGRLVAVNGMWIASKPAAYFNAAWRTQPGGGPILINLIHEIDCLRFICGEIRAITAFTSNAARGAAVEDTASVAIQFENGALGTFLLSDAAVSPYGWEFSSGQALYFPHQPGDCYVLAGREASLAVPSMTLWRHDRPGGHWQDPLVRQTLPLDTSRAYMNQLDHFLAVIRNEAEPIVTARDAMMTLAATLAVTRAAHEARTVALTDMLE